MTPTETFIAESRRICEAAREGPWQREIAGIEGDTRVAATGPWYAVSSNSENLHGDAAFIAHARTALPQALDIIEALVVDRDRWMHSFKELERRHTAHCEASAKYLASMPQPPIVLDADAAELVKQNDIIEAQAKRIAELEQRIADMQDDVNNPPKLRTVCEKECDE